MQIKCSTSEEDAHREIKLCSKCIKAAEELKDIANILRLTAGTDANIKNAMESILKIADRLESRS